MFAAAVLFKIFKQPVLDRQELIFVVESLAARAVQYPVLVG
jgi:hypothetical protein